MSDEILKVDISVNADTKGVKDLKNSIDGIKSSATDAAGGLGKTESSSKKLSETTSETAKNTEGLKDTLDETGESMALTAEHVKTIIEAMVALKGFQEIKESLEFSDEIGKTATKVGMAVEDFSALAHAASLADIDTGSLAMGLQFLNKNAADAATGTGAAYDAFTKLGISVKDSNGNMKSTKELFREVTGAINSVGDASTRTSILMAIFGRSGAGIYELMKDGVVGLDEATKDATKTNAVVTKEMAENAAKTNDQITSMESAFAGAGREIADGFTPVLYSFAKELEAVAVQYGNFLKTLEGKEQLENMENLAHDGAFVMASLAKAIAWVTREFGDALPAIITYYTAVKSIGLVTSGVGEFVNILKNMNSETILLKGETGLLAGKFAQLSVVMNSSNVLFMAGLAGYEIGVKLAEYLGKIYYSNNGLTDEALRSQKEFNKALGQMPVEKLDKLNLGNIDEEVKKTKDNLNTLKKNATELKLVQIFHQAVPGIYNVGAALDVANHKIVNMETYLNNLVQIKKSLKSDEQLFGDINKQNESLKKITDTMDKQIQSYDDRYNVELKLLKASGDTAKADQLESNYSRFRSQVAISGYNNQMRAVDNMTVKLEQYTRSETVDAEKVKQVSKQIADTKRDVYTKAMAAITQSLDYYTNKEKAAKDELKKLADEKLGIDEKYEQGAKELRQTGMTDEQKQLDNYKEIVNKRGELNSLASQISNALANGDIEKAQELKKSFMDVSSEIFSMSVQGAEYFKENNETQWAKNMSEAFAQYGDSIHNAQQGIIGLFQTYQSNVDASTKKPIEDLTSDLENIRKSYSEIDVKLQAIGLDAIKQQFDNAKQYMESNHIKVTVDESTVQHRNSGGIIDYVPGVGDTDTVHLMATPGEFVTKKNAVMNYGVQFFRDLNAMRIPKDKLYAALQKTRPIHPVISLPSREDIEAARQVTIMQMGGQTKPTETVVLEINLGGATLTARTTKDELAEYEKHARRMRLCIPKKK